MTKVGGPTLMIAALALAVAACGGDAEAPQADSIPSLAVVDEPGVYLIRPDGSDLRRLPGAGRLSDTFAWAPTGNRFVLAPGCGTEHELLISTADSSELEKIASLPGGVGRIAWSPSGDTLAVTLNAGAGIARGVVFVNLDDGGVTTIEDASSFLGWSHDGRHYAVSSATGVALVEIATGQRTQVADRVYGGLWSPTEDRFAFTYTFGSPVGAADEPAFGSGVDVVQADGTGRTVIHPAATHAVTGTADAVAWSPDGKRVLVHTGPLFPIRFLLYDVDAPEQPVDLGETFKLSGGAWSPDGEHIAIENTAEGAVAIEIRRADSPESQVQYLADVVSRNPQFSPDGQQLIFIGNGSSRLNDLYLTDVANGPAAATALASTRFNIFHLAWSADGSYIAFVAGPVTSNGC